MRLLSINLHSNYIVACVDQVQVAAVLRQALEGLTIPTAFHVFEVTGCTVEARGLPVQNWIQSVALLFHDNSDEAFRTVVQIMLSEAGVSNSLEAASGAGLGKDGISDGSACTYTPPQIALPVGHVKEKDEETLQRWDSSISTLMNPISTLISPISTWIDPRFNANSRHFRLEALHCERMQAMDEEQARVDFRLGMARDALKAAEDERFKTEQIKVFERRSNAMLIPL